LSLKEKESKLSVAEFRNQMFEAFGELNIVTFGGDYYCGKSEREYRPNMDTTLS